MDQMRGSTASGGGAADGGARLFSAGRAALAVCAAVVVAYYALLLTSGQFGLFHPVPLGLTFNSMLEHMLHGRFDVDPDAVDFEAFVHDGRTYAYWGVFCAVIRLPLMMIPGGRTLDVTVLSSLAAILFGLAFQLAALGLLLKRVPGGPGTRFLGALMAAALVLSGAEVAFMRLSIYQEVCYWGAALGAAFVFLALRGLLDDRFSTRRLIGMAVIAGLALNERVTFGISLYAALGLLVVVLAVRRPSWPERLRLIAPLVVLGLFAAVAGAVNFARWGDPFIFADYHLYARNLRPSHAADLARIDKQGLFNIARAPYGLMYYFLPIWALPGSEQPYLFLDAQRELFENFELPPSTFFLTDPLLVGLFALFLWRLARGRSFVRSPSAAVALLVGLSGGGLVLLTAVSMNFRYRLDFYPLLQLGAFLGLYEALMVHGPRALARTSRAALVAVALVGVVASHVEMALYKISPLGIAYVVFPDGIASGYSAMLHSKAPH